MSLVLTNAGEKLEIVSTVVIPFTVHYADYVGATPVFTPGVAGGDTINGTKDLLAAPGSGQRVVRTISVHNDSGGADTITIQLDDGGTNYTIVTTVLPDNYALYYDEDGWKVLDKNGALATTLFTHALLGPHHSDTVTDTPTRGSMIVVSTWLAWDELVIGGAHQILKVNAGGTDPVWASFDWDDMVAGAAADMVHAHGSAAEGGVNLGPLSSLEMAEDAWQGIGAALERFVFDGSAGEIIVKDAMFVVEGSQGNIVLSNAAGHGNIIEMTRAGASYLRATNAAGAIYVGAGGNADDLQVLANHNVVVANGALGVGVAPSYKFDVKTNIADYMSWFFNDGGDNRHGIKVQCGEDTNPDEYYIRFFDGDGGGIGRVEGDGAGGVTYHSASDERLKEVLGPIDQKLALEALIGVNPIRYTGKGAKRQNFGFSAQDVHRYFPEVATHNEKEDSYGISYERLVPVLWVQSQALLKRIEQLEV